VEIAATMSGDELLAGPTFNATRAVTIKADPEHIWPWIGFFAQNSIPKSALMPGLNNPSTFEWFLRCLSAALTEEIFFRLGLMTFFVWVLRSIIRKPANDVPSLWVGNLLSALVFASAHLPQLTFHGWSLLIPFVMFSSSAGMVMGWLYMRYGLVSAIVAHFIGDLMVYVVPRLAAVIV